MVVRVAQRAQSRTGNTNHVRVVVACDSALVVDACALHGVEAVLTRTDHASGSDRLAEACDLLALADDSVVVNVQGDEPLIDPDLVDAVALLLNSRGQASIATAAHRITTLADYRNPNVVKVVLDHDNMALYFSRAAIPVARDAPDIAWWDDTHGAPLLQAAAPLRHIGIYAYRAGFVRAFPGLPRAPLEVAEALEQLRAMWHGYRIAVHVTGHDPGPGVDTPADLQRVRNLFVT